MWKLSVQRQEPVRAFLLQTTIVLTAVGLIRYLLGAQVFAPDSSSSLGCFMCSCNVVKRKRGSHRERKKGVRREEREENPGI